MRISRSSDIIAVMASHALSRSLHSSRNHLIAYLPSLSAAATYFRAFCSDHDRSGRTINVEIMVESASDKDEGLPLTSWGPLGAGDARFPLPGQMGIGSLESENTEELNQVRAIPPRCARNFRGRGNCTEIFPLEEVPLPLPMRLLRSYAQVLKSLIKSKT